MTEDRSKPSLHWMEPPHGEGVPSRELVMMFGYFGDEREPMAAILEEKECGDLLVLIPREVLTAALAEGWDDPWAWLRELN
jgi:hypothetical protein